MDHSASTSNRRRSPELAIREYRSRVRVVPRNPDEFAI